VPFVRLTIETDRGPVSVLEVLAEVPNVGETLVTGGRTVTVQTVDNPGNGEPIHVTAIEVSRAPG
jgi:hypothetical protein